MLKTGQVIGGGFRRPEKRCESPRETPALRALETKRFHRLKAYDYSRGAAVFVTFHLEPRRPFFGRVIDGKMAYSPAGEIARRVLAKEAARSPDVQLMRSAIMPDHVHFRLYLRPGQAEPLKKLGQFVANFKAWSRNLAKSELGLEFAWQKNYHDWVCVSREMIELVDKYIDNNVLKEWLMHGDPPPLRVREPIMSELLPAGEWWSGVGRVDWIANEGPQLAAVRLSRSIPASEFPAVTKRLLAAAAKGYVLAGTWISPCERFVFDRLVAAGRPVIRASQDPLALVYRPKRDEPPLFAAGRYLLLSRVFAEGTARGVGWHSINDDLAAVANRRGKSVYVTWSPAGGLDWAFGS